MALRSPAPRGLSRVSGMAASARAWAPAVVRRGLAGARVVALVVIGLAACSDDETTAPPSAPPSPAPSTDPGRVPPVPPDSPPRQSLAQRITPLLQPPPPPPGTADIAPGIEPTGVPECDDYIRRYLRCIEQVMPAESKAPIREAMTSMAQTWRDALRDHGAAEPLATACRAADEAARSAFSTTGCAWE